MRNPAIPLAKRLTTVRQLLTQARIQSDWQLVRELTEERAELQDKLDDAIEAGQAKLEIRP